MAESSWPSPDDGRNINDFEYERVAVSYGPVAGLIGSPSSAAMVYGDASGRQVKIPADRYGYVRGYEWWSGTTELIVAIAANAGAQRLDLVVLRLSRTTWNVTVAVITGTPGSGVPPSLTQNTANSGVWELPLAIVTVTTGATSISAGQVQFLGLYLGTSGAGYIVDSVATLSYVPHPHTGQIVTVVGLSRQYQYTGSAWARFPAVAAPVKAVVGSNVLASTTEGVLLTANYTATAGETVRVTYSGVYSAPAATRQMTIRIKADGVTLHATADMSSAVGWMTQVVIDTHSPAAGARVYTATAQMDAFTGTIIAGSRLIVEPAA